MHELGEPVNGVVETIVEAMNEDDRLAAMFGLCHVGDSGAKSGAIQVFCRCRYEISTGVARGVTGHCISPTVREPSGGIETVT